MASSSKKDDRICSFGGIPAVVSKAKDDAAGPASDRTAQAVAKVRHYETLYPAKGSEKRLFEDPYAKEFYIGSSIASIMPRFVINKLMTLSDRTGGGGATYHGLTALLTGRTKEFDMQVQAAVEAGCTQYVILGAGYDTRAVRLRLPASVTIFEVDQPDVQKKKIAGYRRIAARGDKQVQALFRGGTSRLKDSNVHFVAVDFNKETIDQKLREHPRYDTIAPTVFTLEGVTQYITKAATESTIRAAASVCGANSRFVISYAPQNLWDNPEKLGIDKRVAKKFLATTASTYKEPWISGFHKGPLSTFMRKNGFEVQRDVSMEEMVNEHFAAAGRTVPVEQRMSFERYAVAFKI